MTTSFEAFAPVSVLHTSIRVVVADDHPIVRQGLRLLLSVAPGFEVVGEAKNGSEAVALVAAARPSVRRDTLSDLTAREREVLSLVGQSLANQKIADQLKVSIRTVHTHIRNILDKLGLSSRLQIALYARDHAPS